MDDIDLVEINEAFASVVLAWQKETGADLDKGERQRRRDRARSPARRDRHAVCSRRCSTSSSAPAAATGCRRCAKAGARRTSRSSSGFDSQSPTAFEIQGRTLTFPIEVRDADSWAAQFLVPAKAAQRDRRPDRARSGAAAAGPCDREHRVRRLPRHRPRRLQRARDRVPRPSDGHVVGGDAVRQDARVRLADDIGVYIHQLPVTQTFTLEAGQRSGAIRSSCRTSTSPHAGGMSRARSSSTAITRPHAALQEGGYRSRFPQQNLATYSLRDTSCGARSGSRTRRSKRDSAAHSSSSDASRSPTSCVRSVSRSGA